MGKSKKSIISKLPATHQTSPNKRFFRGTVEQLFSKRNSEKVSGYIGRRIGGEYDPKADNYVSQPFGVRNNYSLEPIALSADPETLENSNEFFYEDIVNFIKSYGGDVSNHDRLFDSNYQSWAPPIDIDKFINYDNYIWINRDWPIISIDGLTDTEIESDIIDAQSYTYVTTQNFTVPDPWDNTITLISEYYDSIISVENITQATTIDEESYIIDNDILTFNDEIPAIADEIRITYQRFTLETGFIVTFPSSSNYTDNYYVHNVGCSIELLPFNDNTTNPVAPIENYEFIPWDSTDWDETNWDAERGKAFTSYFTMERGACDNNVWSRTNFWFKRSTINLAYLISGVSVPSTNTIAERPIIDFKRCLELYRSGSKFLTYVDAIDDVTFEDVHNRPQASLLFDGIALEDEMLIAFLNPSDPLTINLPWDQEEWDCESWDAGSYLNDIFNTIVWKVNIVDDVIKLIPEFLANEGDTITSNGGSEFFGATFFSENSRWVRAQSERTSINVAPLFMLYDCEGIELDDSIKYPQSDFNGSKIFGYKIDDFSPINDPILGFPISYRTVSSISDIEFSNFLEAENFSYVISNTLTDINSDYFYNCRVPRDDFVDETPILINSEGSTQFSYSSFDVDNVYQSSLLTVDNNNNIYFFERTSNGWVQSFTENIFTERGYTLTSYGIHTSSNARTVYIDDSGTYAAIGVEDGASSGILVYRKVGNDWTYLSEFFEADLRLGKHITIARTNNGLFVSNVNDEPGLEEYSVYSWNCDNNTWTNIFVDNSNIPVAIYTNSNDFYNIVLHDNGLLIEYDEFDTALPSVLNLPTVGPYVSIVEDGDAFFILEVDKVTIIDRDLNIIKTIDLSGLSTSLNSIAVNGHQISLSDTDDNAYLIHIDLLDVSDVSYEVISTIAITTNDNILTEIVQNQWLISNPSYNSNEGAILSYQLYEECDLLDNLENGWREIDGESKQRVIDRYVIENVNSKTFELSVLPFYENNSYDVIVRLNGNIVASTDYNVVNDKVTVNLDFSVNDVIEFFSYAEVYCYETFEYSNTNIFKLTNEVNDEKEATVSVNNINVAGNNFRISKNSLRFNQGYSFTPGDIIEIHYESSDNLIEKARGYYEIPASLEKNPMYEDVTTHTLGDFNRHFISIIQNQPEQLENVQIGSNNEYQNSCKNLSLGDFIWRHDSSLLKSMFVASEDDLNIIESIRYSQREYSRYKNKFIKYVKEALDLNTLTNDFSRNFNDIVNRVIKTSENGQAFKESYMFSFGQVFDETTLTDTSSINSNNQIVLPDGIDYTLPENSVYVFTTSGNNVTTLLIDSDYELSMIGGLTITFSQDIVDDLNNANIDSIIVREYENTAAPMMPSTPTKLGLWDVHVPKIINDNTYITPNDQTTGRQFILGHDGSKTPLYGDVRDDYLLELEKRIFNNINEKFRSNTKKLLQLEDVIEGRFRKTKWLKEEINDILGISFYKWANRYNVNWQQNEYIDLADEWSFNYEGYGTELTNIPAYWRGIFRYYYDTETPHITPWEMLGFGDQPSWWEDEYGTDYSSSNAAMWADIESGTIAQGPRQGVDEHFIRPNLVSNYLPVNGAGELLSPTTIGLSTEPQLDEEKSKDFFFGDGSPMESLWYQSSEYRFSCIELLFLTKPAKFSELYWNPLSLERSEITNTLIDSGECRRRDFNDQLVHRETIDGQKVYRAGYQHWISDRLSFLDKNITNVFGEKVRRLNVKLGHKLAGYTNPDRVQSKFISTNLVSTTQSNLVPNENLNVKINTSPVVDTFDYSGIIIRSLEDGSYKVYGYNLLYPYFTCHPRSDSSTRDTIEIGGKPESFKIFEFGQTYTAGEIVKYNTIFYRCLETHTAVNFIQENWVKLDRLPRKNAIRVEYRAIPNRDKTYRIEYGQRFESAQELFNFIIEYGDWLETKGWKFEEVDNETGTINNWLQSAREAMFWINQQTSLGSVIRLSPNASRPVLEVNRGYPASIERESNGIYSILNTDGVVIDPKLTAIEREGRRIEIDSRFRESGIYFSRIQTKETEHILVYDNVTTFNDVIYSPLFSERQSRLKIDLPRSKEWIGNYEADGYIINDDGTIVPNFENTTNSIRLYHDRNDFVDNVDIENAARHLIGYNEMNYLTELDLDSDVQFLFYSGMIREKGTIQSIKKLLRSVYVRQDQDIDFYDEWAIRLADYGGVAENVAIDFEIRPEDIKVDPQVITLSSEQSKIGTIERIELISIDTIFESTPTITIVANPTDSNIDNIVDATAEAKLDAQGKIQSIDITNNGSGYTIEPNIIIDGGSVFDIAYPILVKTIDFDSPNDNIIHIDVDDDQRWVIKPRESSVFDLWPTTNKTNYNIPNAGYVMEDDVDHMIFDINNINDYLLENKVNDGDYIWTAKGFNRQWDVYRLTDFGLRFVLAEVNSNLFMFTEKELPIDIFGQNRFHPNKAIIHDVLVDGELQSYAIDLDTQQTSFIPFLPFQYKINSIINLKTGEEDTPDLSVFYDNLFTYKSVRFDTVADRVAFQDFFRASSDYYFCYNYDDLVYIDNDGEGSWIVQQEKYNGSPIPWDSRVWDCPPWDSGNSGWVTVRRQDLLVDTNLFKNAFLYDSESKDTLARLPVFDPFKDIIPGPAKQNLSYITKNDPARYTNAADIDLIDENKVFTNIDVGKLWWDISQCAVLYYEMSDLKYRRNNWGKFFSGSEIAVYEWTRSLTLPEDYTGEGTPRNITDYVAIQEFDPNRNREVTAYYFWVRGRITKTSNRQNRSLSSNAVESLIRNPKANQYRWFSPIAYESDTNDIKNSFMLSNFSDIATNRNSGLQINYRYSDQKVPVHNEWTLIRSGDVRNRILDSLWKKLIDSLIGFTIPVEIEDDVSGKLPSTDPNKFYLMVPDPSLSDAEKYGVRSRPRQSMFKDVKMARRVAIDKINSLLDNLQFRTLYPNIYDLITSDNFWRFDDWYAEGYDSNLEVTVITNGIASLNTIRSDLKDGDIVKVRNAETFDTLSGTEDIFHIYIYNQTTNSYTLIAKEKNKFVLNELAWKTDNNILIRDELRQIFEVMVYDILGTLDNNELNDFYFAMLNQVFSEQEDLDWAFRTTYTVLNQLGSTLDQSTFLENNPLDNLLEYVRATKPYHTKIRDYFTNLTAPMDIGTITAEEEEFLMVIKMIFNSVTCGGWDTLPWDNADWEGEFAEQCGSDELIVDSGSFEEEFNIIYSGSDEVMGEAVFEEIVPDLTFEGETNIINYLLNLNVTDDIVYVFVNGVQTLNVTYNDLTETILGISGETDYLIPVQELILEDYRGNGDFNVTLNGVPQTDGVDYTISVISDEATISFTSPLVDDDEVEINYQLLRFYDEITNGDVIDIYNELPFESSAFYNAHVREGVPDELAPLTSDDNLFFTVIEDGDTCTLAYTLYQSFGGVFKYWRRMPGDSAILNANFNIDDDEIQITSGAGLPSDVSVLNPGIIRVGNELILYHERDGNTLRNLVRGYDNTTISDHESGDRVWNIRGSDIPNATFVDWGENVDGQLIGATTVQGTFLNDLCPALPLNLEEPGDFPLNLEET